MTFKHFISGFLGGVFAFVCLGGLVLFVFDYDSVFMGERHLKTEYKPEGQSVNLLSQANKQIADEVIFSFSEAAELATPAVVHIKAEESQQQMQSRKNRRPFSFEDFFRGGMSPFYRREGSGSGVVFSSDGFIVTNNHVVEFADVITITLHDGRSFEAQKVGTAPEEDIAVLKIDAFDLPTIPWANTDKINVGDWVLAIGNPFDYLTSTVTAGIVSAKGRDLDIGFDERAHSFSNFIQTDAAINPGNSGGALVNAKGELLGINTAIATPTGVFAGYSFAIPVENVQDIVEKILAKSTNKDMGISVTNMDKQLADYLNVSETEGVLILETEAGSAAKYGGLKPYDLIMSINDIPVETIAEMESILYDPETPDILLLRILRDGSEKIVNIKLR